MSTEEQEDEILEHLFLGPKETRKESYTFVPRAYIPSPPYYLEELQKGTSDEILLWPPRLSKANRRHLQLVEIERRLTHTGATMLVIDGRIYSATSIWGVIKLFLFVKLFPKRAKKKYPGLK